MRSPRCGPGLMGRPGTGLLREGRPLNLILLAARTGATCWPVARTARGCARASGCPLGAPALQSLLDGPCPWGRATCQNKLTMGFALFLAAVSVKPCLEPFP